MEEEIERCVEEFNSEGDVKAKLLAMGNATFDIEFRHEDINSKIFEAMNRFKEMLGKKGLSAEIGNYLKTDYDSFMVRFRL